MTDQFYYDVLNLPGQRTSADAYTLDGRLDPLFAVETLERSY